MTKHKVLKRSFEKTTLFIVLLIVSIMMLIPLFWMLSTALKNIGEVFEYPPRWIPRTLNWQNFKMIWQLVPFKMYLVNSLIMSGFVTLIHLIVASLSAYAFARLEFPGRNTLFLLYIATMMIPGQVTMIPNFILVKTLGWTDTYIGLILPNCFMAFGVFLLRQFFLTIPKDYEEAATIDGANKFMIFRKIILPLSLPAISTLAIFTFVGQWNNLLWPLVIINKEEMKTLTLGLASFQGMYSTSWNLLMAAAVMGILPSVIAFIIGQKYLIKGITLSGLKG